MNHHYFLSDTILGSVIHGQHNIVLVVLSLLVAALAGLCAFSIVDLTSKTHTNRTVLILLGGLVLGLGVWGMHFTGMLAFSLPITILYDPEITIISIFPAIVASIIFLENLSKRDMSLNRVILVGLFLAIGIGSMHFIGMAAMSMQAYMTHDLLLYIMAILSSWGLAVLTIKVYQSTAKLSVLNRRKHIVICAATFGFSVASMHYLAMFSTYFIEDKTIEVVGIGDEYLTSSLIIFIVILMITLLIVIFYQNKLGHLQKLAKLHRYRVIDTIDNMQDAFVLGDSSGKVILVNRAFTEKFGASVEPDLIGAGTLSMLHNQLFSSSFCFDSELEKNSMLAALNDDDCVDIELRVLDTQGNWWLFRRCKTPTGEIIQTWTDINSQISQEHELKVAKDAAITALTQLKDAQEELVETKKMASLGGLVTGVAHELNTPLGISITALSAMKELVKEIQMALAGGTLQKGQLESSVKSIIEFEKLVANNLEKMTKLVQQFKFISIDQSDEALTSFNIDNKLNDLLLTKKGQLAQQGINITKTIAFDGEVTTYENVLMQVIDCLMTNSIEHAFSQNTQAVIMLGITSHEGYLNIVCKDNGCGIDSRIKDEVFEPFVTTNRGGGGVGLGLHIAYNLVTQKLKGKIKLLEASEEFSTIFWISIPLQTDIELGA